MLSHMKTEHLERFKQNSMGQVFVQEVFILCARVQLLTLPLNVGFHLSTPLGTAGET